MCLKVKSGPHKATKDLYVIKMTKDVTAKGFKTWYERFPMEFGQVYRTEMEIDDYDDNNNSYVDSGFHSLRTSTLEDNLYWPTNEPFDLRPRRAITLCKIPKGSNFYLGSYSDVVSDTLEPMYHLMISSFCDDINAEGESFELPYLHYDPSWIRHLIEVCASYGIKLY